MSRITTTFAVAVLLVLGLASATRAQEKDDIIRPITKQGSAAWVFTFAGFGQFNIAAPTIGTPNNVPVFGAGVKYYMSDDMALRIMLGFANQSADTAVALTQGSQGPDHHEGFKYTNYGIAVGAEWHRTPLWSVSPYWGAQISYAGSTYDNGASGNNEVKYQRNTFGIFVLGGFDWFFTHALALGAEIPVGFMSTGGSNTFPAPSTGTTTTADVATLSTIGFGSASAHFIAYF